MNYLCITQVKVNNPLKKPLVKYSSSANARQWRILILGRMNPWLLRGRSSQNKPLYLKGQGKFFENQAILGTFWALRKDILLTYLDLYICNSIDTKGWGGEGMGIAEWPSSPPCIRHWCLKTSTSWQQNPKHCDVRDSSSVRTLSLELIGGCWSGALTRNRKQNSTTNVIEWTLTGWQRSHPF